MTTPPITLPTGTVRWLLAASAADGGDPGAAPDLTGGGTVTFVPSARYVRPAGATVFPLIRTYPVPDDGELTATLEATDGTWHWTAHHRRDGALLLSVPFTLTAGEAKDLADAVPLVVRDGLVITKGDKGDPGEPGAPGAGVDPADLSKLDGIEAGATRNATDAALRDRSTHTGMQTSASIADLREYVEDTLGAMFRTTGADLGITYDDAAGTVTLGFTPGSPAQLEAMQDALGAALVGVGNVSIVYDDASATVTVSTSATVNATDAALRDRSTHTGTQAAATIADLAAAVQAVIDGNGTPNATPGALVRRAPVNGGDAGGWAVLSILGLEQNPGAPDHATRRDWVEGLVAAGDAALDGRLDTVEADLPTRATAAALTAESAARTSADTSLSGRLSTAETTLSGAAAFPPHTANPVNNAGMALSAVVANRTNYVRVIGGGPATVTRIWLNIGASSGNVAVAVYENSGSGTASTPGARVAASGSVPCPAAGTSIGIPLTAPVTVRPGMWLAFSCDNTTATFIRQNGVNNAGVSGGWARRQDNVFPPPATPSSPGTDGSTWVMVGQDT